MSCTTTRCSTASQNSVSHWHKDTQHHVLTPAFRKQPSKDTVSDEEQPTSHRHTQQARNRRRDKKEEDSLSPEDDSAQVTRVVPADVKAAMRPFQSKSERHKPYWLQATEDTEHRIHAYLCV